MPRKAKVKRRTLDHSRTIGRKKKVEESEDEYSDSSNNHESSEEESESEVDQEESSASDDYQPSSTDDDEEEEELEADDEDFVVKKPKKKKRQTDKRRMQVAPKRSSLETIGELNDSDSSVPQPIKKRSSVARRVIDDDDDSQSSGNRRQNPRKMIGSTLKRRSPRKMTTSTSKRLAEMSDDDEKMPMIPQKKSASDEEYVESGQDDDDDINDDESDFDEESGSEEESNPNNAVNIDNDDIFSAEESADEDELIYVKPPPKRKENTRTRAVDIDNDQIASPEDSSSEEEEQPRRRRNIREIRPSQGLTSSSDDDSDEEIARCPICPSTDDAITLERLPEKHVCFISPDGTSRQCFALETLRKIALTSTFFKARVDLDGATRQNFLQPPHFRSPMSDDMLDQIASRFGRDALNIHGDYYKRKRSTPGGSFSDVEDMFSETYRADETFFQDQVRDYVKRQMGSQDVYTCPLCYTEMHKRMVKKDFDPRSSINQPSRDSGDEESDIDKYPPDSVYDPMLVLEYLDNGFEAASFFCFKRVAQLKKHLREDHGVSTNQIQGNELYKRYSIRSPDGLLQRWLSGDHRRYAPSQGSMSTYWSSGNNFNFVLLLYKMNIAEQYRDLVESTTDEEERERTENYMAVAFDYFESFQDHALASWAQLSRPFEKGNDDDIRDFLDDDNDVEDDVETPHFAMRRQFEMNDSDSAQNAFVHDLERKYGGSGASDDDDDDESSSSQSSSDDDDEGKKGNKEANTEINTLNGYYSDVQEETDPWMLQKLSARKSLGSGRRKERPTTTMDLTNLPDSTTGKKLFQTPSLKKKKQTLVTNSTAKKPALSRTSSSTKRKRPVLEDSSSSDDDDSVLVIE